MPTDTDYMASYWASKDLARTIESYWHRQGYHHVRASVIKENLPSGMVLYSVRTNMKFAAVGEGE